MRLISDPAVADAARATIDTRVRLGLCPPSSPMWRHLSVQAEAAWQALYERVGRNHAAANLALREMGGLS